VGFILAGIDEAGYGPMLGPLTVGLSVFRVPDQPEGTPPNLWTLLSTGLCREPGRGGKADAKGRLAIADSKQLKLSNSVTTTHPLVHLERGVLGMLRLRTPGDGAAESNNSPATDAELFAALGTTLPAHACYGGAAVPIPLSGSAFSIGIGANVAARAMVEHSVELLALRCRAVGEDEFNRIVREKNNKAATSAGAIAEHLRHVWERYADPAMAGGKLGIVCDRLGGRACYADFLKWALRCEVEIVEESETRSKYVLTDGPRRAGVAFLVEGESAHLPVALASMAAKLVRELAMHRFNRHWSGMASLKPTAGYAQDARRWLDDAAPILTPTDRHQLVRIA
jgi:hypothetical protein